MELKNRTQGALFLIGGALMVIGVGAFVLFWHREVMCWVFLAGALLFALTQIMQSVDTSGITLKRLKTIQGLADLLFILSGIIMADTANGFFRPLFQNQEAYLTYLYNKWVVLLLIAAVLEVYTTHRIDHEQSKKNIKDDTQN